MSTPSLRLFTSRLTQGAYRGVPRPRHAVVHSVDHDGCLGLPYSAPNRIALLHEPLITHLKDQYAQKAYTDGFVMIGSNRQDLKCEAINGLYNKNGLAYPQAYAFAKSLGFWFDPFLLSDITANQKAGFNLTLLRTMASKHGVKLHHDIVSDDFLKKLRAKKYPRFDYSEDKVNIIYAQIHRAASALPGRVDFYFYDNDHRILSSLRQFYQTFPILIPANVKLHLSHYDTDNVGERPQHQGGILPDTLTVIQGTGPIDENYRQTVSVMGDIAKREEGKVHAFHLAEYLTPQLLQESGSVLCHVGKQVCNFFGGFFKTPDTPEAKGKEAETSTSLKKNKQS